MYRLILNISIWSQTRCYIISVISDYTDDFDDDLGAVRVQVSHDHVLACFRHPHPTVIKCENLGYPSDDHKIFEWIFTVKLYVYKSNKYINELLLEGEYKYKRSLRSKTLNLYI